MAANGATNGAANGAEEPMAEAMAELSKKLGLFERVRHLCQAVDIPLPGVVVVGEQSAGKSSLLENISGIQFPRAQNTCTRMPCVLTMLTDPTIQEPYALVSMDPGAFEHKSCCKVAEVEGRIKILTEEHAQGEEFISRKALFVRVVRPSGPQLSLIDLPGVTHNAEKMKDIHEVTVRLVEEYIKPQEMVILCVIPAMSDFGNAEVIKLARKFDPAGQRTLGVVTKCDDAAKAEASDIVEKVLMTRDSDVRLALGFHCVVNRSQKNIDEGMSRTELWQKEEKVFKGSERLRSLPLENWGTSRLMEKIASIQEARVDECLPKIKESVRTKTLQLRQELRSLPPQAETEADQFRLFNSILVKISADLERRVRAEYIGTEDCDRDLAIAPKVARMVDAFRKELFAANPEWLGQEMIDEVTDTVETFVHGYTVGNLTGPQVFINLIKRIFVEDGLLQREVTDLIERVAEHLGQVVHHLIEQHADLNNVFAARLSMKADEVIDQLTAKATGLCDALARAQAVTSTTHGAYMVKLTQFRKSWLREGAERLQQGAERLQEVAERVRRILSGMDYGAGPSDAGASHAGVLTPEFVDLVQAAQTEPQKLTILEICASLHVYTGFMIEGFVEMAAKLVKFYMVEELGSELQESWRMDLGGSNLHELFPKDVRLVQKRDRIKQMMDQLAEFMEQLSTLRMASIATPKNVRRTFGQRVAEKVDTQHEAKKAETDTQPANGRERAGAKVTIPKKPEEAEKEDDEEDEEEEQEEWEGQEEWEEEAEYDEDEEGEEDEDEEEKRQREEAEMKKKQKEKEANQRMEKIAKCAEAQKTRRGGC